MGESLNRMRTSDSQAGIKERIARFWTAYFLNTGRPVTITASDVSPMMRLMKEARLCETPDHYDSHVDLVGYTLTGAEVNGVQG